MNMTRVTAVLAAAILGSVLVVSAASAKQERLLATPSAVCSTLVQWGAGGYSSFGDCMGRLNKDVSAYRSEDDEGNIISLSERCAQFEAGIYDPQVGGIVKLTYPFFFGEGAPDSGWPFPEFTAQNHRQCELTLYAYHTLVTIFG